jgi:hypothetical protein
VGPGMVRGLGLGVVVHAVFCFGPGSCYSNQTIHGTFLGISFFGKEM